MAGTNGYAPVRRGLLEHLADMPGSDVKCYLALLLMANPYTGIVRITVRDLADTLGTSANRVSESLRRLSGPHGPTRVRYIDYTPASNQHAITSVVVRKWQRPSAVTKTDTATDTAIGQQSDSNRTASGQHTHCDLRKGGSESQKSQKSQKTYNKGVSSDTVDECVLGYWQDKAGRDVTLHDLRSLSSIQNEVGPARLKEAIGQACVQGAPADNYRLIRTIARAL